MLAKVGGNLALPGHDRAPWESHVAVSPYSPWERPSLAAWKRFIISILFTHKQAMVVVDDGSGDRSSSEKLSCLVGRTTYVE